MIFEILVSTSKFWKKFVTRVRPYWDKFWKILTFEFCQDRKVMINHRGGILIFGQILNFGENRNFEILNPSSNPNFGSLTLKLNFVILTTKVSNFDESLTNFDEIIKFGDWWNFEFWWNLQFWWMSKFEFWQNLEIWQFSPKSNHQFG